MRNRAIPGLLILLTSLTACGKGTIDDKDEVAQNVGDVMASFDESAQGGGDFAFKAPGLREPDFSLASIHDWLVPQASAASCLFSFFTPGCPTDRTRTRTFSSCTLGTSTLDGTVTLAFSASNCSLSEPGSSVTRTANFTLTGRKGGTLTVTAPGGGQTITKTAEGAHTYAVGGMRRVMADSSGKTLFDIETRTTAPISVTGTSRANRVLDGGVLEVKHNLRNYTVTLRPTALTWSSSCTCAVSGSLSGTVSGDQEAKTFTIELTGCGIAKVTADDRSEDVTLDRCSGTTG